MLNEAHDFSDQPPVETNLAREMEFDAMTPKEDPWAGIAIPRGYALSQEGVFLITAPKSNPTKLENSSNSAEFTKIKISDPVWVAGRFRDLKGSNSGIIVKWIDLDGQERISHIERRQLHAQGNGIAERLAHDNLQILHGEEKKLAKYLTAFVSQNTVRAVKNLGWLENPTGELIYVSSTGTLRNVAQEKEGTEAFIFQPESVVSAGPSTQGSLEEWKENIAAFCKGNDLLIFLQCQALAGPLAKFSGTGSFGSNISGKTSKGKTTATQVAASIWGCGADPADAPQLSIIRKWHSTANAFEVLAAQRNDGVLLLDELGTCPSKDLDKVIYNLFGGTGKQRLNPNSEAKQTRNWCMVVISTGEKSLYERLQETDSKSPPEGIFVRFIDIAIEEVVSNYHGMPPKDFVDKLKVNCGKYYGIAGKQFIQSLINQSNNSQTLRESIRLGITEIISKLHIPNHLSQQQERVLQLFGLIALAGTLAIQWGILPYTVEEVINAVRNIFIFWLQDHHIISDDVRAIALVRDLFIRKRDSAFKKVNSSEDEKRYGDILGYLTEEGVFYLNEGGIKEALKGMNEKRSLEALKKAGYLIQKEAAGRNRSKVTINKIQMRVYVICESICEFDKDKI